MRGRGGVGAFLIFVLLSIIILLKIRSMIEKERFFSAINSFEQKSATGPGKIKLPSGGRGQEYPGDEGDWLVWAFRVEPKTLNNFSAENDIYAKWMTVPYIFEPLLFYNFDDLTMEPHLAKSYSISDDGLEITFVLRDDIHFSDGVPVTADDVIFTYETVMNPGVDAANIANLYIDVDHVERIDTRTVKFVMKRRHFKALENLSFWDFGILPKHEYKFDDPQEFNKRRSNPVGSGPFVFERWDSGRQIVLRRNENYWGPKPKLEKIVFKFITNVVAAIQSLRSGEVDMIIPEPDQFAELAADEQFTKDFRCLSFWSPGSPFYYIGWNQERVFFKDKRVRLAMTHVIDREKIIAELLKGHGETITGPFFIKGPVNDKSIEPWPYDPQHAKELLDEAGWTDSDGDGLRDKDGVTLRFKFMYSSDKVLYQRLSRLLKNEAAKIGVEVIPDPFEWSVVITKITAHDYDSMVMGWGGDVLEDPYQLWHSSQIENRGSNYVGFSNETADVLIEQGRQILDAGKRNELYRKLGRILHEEQPYTFLYARPTFRLLDKRYENVKIYKSLGVKYWEWHVPKERQRYK